MGNSKQRPLSMQNSLKTLRKFKKRLQLVNLPFVSYYNSAFIGINSGNQFVVKVSLDGYFHSHTLPLTPYTFRFKATNPTELYCKLYKYKIVSYKIFNVLISDIKYFRRNKRQAYVNGTLSYFIIIDIYYDDLLNECIKVKRNDGKIFSFKKQSFYVLFTARPKYQKIVQLKMF